MKKEVILIPKDKCPLDVIAELGSQARNAWIFLHDNAVTHLEETASYVSVNDECQKMTWCATKSYPATVLRIEKNALSIWAKVYEIDASDIAFEKAPMDPENIFFLKMDS